MNALAVLVLLVVSAGLFTPSVNAKETAIMDEERLALAKASPANQIEVIDRDNFGKIVHVYGDSIACGYGYGKFEYDRTFNRIQDIAQKYLAYQGVSKSEIYFRYARSQSSDLMADDLFKGLIRKGDVVLFEDAGPHENNIEKRSIYLGEIINVFKNSGINLVLTTMFEYSPSPVYFNSYYDQPVTNNESMNRLVVRLSDKCCDVLDWNAQMDNLSNRISIRYAIYPTHSDGVHPNIIGNFLLAKSILNYLGVPTVNNRPMKLLFKKELGEFCKQLPCGEVQASDILQDEIFSEIEKQAGNNLLVAKEKRAPFFLDIRVTLKAYMVGFYRSVFVAAAM